MTIDNESPQLIIEKQEKLLATLKADNELLYHQYNHQTLRNNKLLKRIEELQQIIEDLHLSIDKMQSNNHRRIQQHAFEKVTLHPMEKTSVELTAIYERWKNYPGQQARNAPNLRKQVQMLAHLLENEKLSATELFSRTGINGVTGARYVATLKKFNLIEYRGARKKGEYYITEQGRKLFENDYVPESVQSVVSNETPSGIVEAVGINRAEEFKTADTSVTHSHLDPHDL